jgi:hypothetical protein
MRIFLRVINNGDNINNNAFYPINLILTNDLNITQEQLTFNIVSMTSTKSKKKPKSKPIKEKELKKGGDIKERETAKHGFIEIRELEALSNLAVNVRKLAKFQKQDHRDKLYSLGAKNRATELFKIYDRIIDRLISDYQKLGWATKENMEEKKKP